MTYQFTFLYPSIEKDFEDESKEAKERYYMYKDLPLHNLTIGFVLGLWLIKDNAVNVNHSYHFNPLINYNSTANRTLNFTLSSGEIKSIYFNESEINNSISLMYDIYSILLKKSDLTKISSSESYGTTYWSIEDFISDLFSKGNTSSYARAFICIQEARSTGFIPTKISKYCACLECLFAIKEKHSNQIKDITSKLLAKNSKEEQQIASDMGDAYGIRSDIDHGGEIKYFRDLKNEEVRELSKRLDNYVRQTIKYVLNNPDLNYTMQDIEHKASTRKHFKDLTYQKK
ncbi:HEPN domain-containing protein [Mammaliicoccus sciuri]|uniref:HEPN domain-containing protein n=1 Tax=Mammaliicoccus sciuri TaxID=1296 RepID=UPI001EF3D74F|nr:HEPN domain-containing protein [Mammaliicoccus sciuri]